MLISLSTK